MIAISAALATGGCSAATFNKATDSFATATTGGVDALAPAFKTASSVCRLRARMHFLATRGLGDNDTDWTSWFAGHKLGKTQFTWKDHCEALKQSDEMLRLSMVTIGVYAAALKSVTAGGDYDGASLKTMIEDAATLGTTLAKNDTPTKIQTDEVKGLGAPIGTIGKYLLAGYTAKQLRASIRDTAPALAAILAALKAYNAAVAATFSDAESLTHNAINVANSSIMFEDYRRAEDRARALDEWSRRLGQDPKASPEDQKRAANEAKLAAEDAEEALAYMTRKPADHRVWRRIRPDAMKVLELDDFAVRSEGDLAAIRAQWAAFAVTLADLEKANQALLDAANGKTSDEDALKLVAGFANDVAAQIALLGKVVDRVRSDP